MKKRFKVGELCYYCCFYMYMSTFYICSMSNFSSFPISQLIYKLIAILVMIPLLILPFCHKQKLKAIIMKIIIIGIVSYSTYVNSSWFLLVTILFILSSVQVDFKRMIKLDLIIKALCLIIIGGAAFLGLIESSYTQRFGNLINNSLGFRHTNILGLFIMMFFFEIFYFYGRRLSYIQLISCYLFIYFFSGSRSVLVSMVVFCFFYSVLVIREKRKWRPRKYYSLFLICSLLSMIAVKYYHPNNIFFRLDIFLSKRIYLSSLAYNYYGFSIIGQDTKYLLTSLNNLYGFQSIYIDNAYVSTLINNGILILAGYFVLYKKSIQKAIKNDDIKMLCIMMSLLIYGLMENKIFDIGTNVFLVYLMTKTKKKGVLYE
ncbi:hypothetical protein ACFFIF_05015 [Vagococcus entomophilus]|uniref:Polysaccharide polymerase n=1 Tax=Vagococcus entomophilus TaxID=1160095 RepID=A0A430AIE8_9ENTE|nr:hypothetical protein [Vagococcus entomophilus]RSU07860.1 hypothetical protein CBF30_01065 [Vagococcus entomophilus]